MNDLEFLEENELHIKSRRLLGIPASPTMVRFLLRSGVAKNEKQALFILFTAVALIIVLTIYLANVLLLAPEEGPSYIQDRFGNQYTPEQYTDLLKRGKDPLSPGFIK